MKVNYASPNPEFVSWPDKDKLANDPRFVELEGWLKWRQQPAKETVEVGYYMGM